ncbi:MAG TPA: hypothetical protein VER36_01810 [Flavisolibacter sp.]|nr:hypothetical protein [Flavisolibacter sp.]
MKTKLFSVAAAVLLASACSDNKGGRFLDLTSGEEVELTEDEDGRLIDKKTGNPVLLYVDRRTADTIYAPSGKVVNDYLEYDEDDNVYGYEDGERQIKIDGGEYKMKDGDVKVKKDFDGSEYKYKNDNVTIKHDGDDYKVEGDGYTKKVDGDGDIKIETKDKKYKIDGETGERKVKERSVFGKAKDKITGQ